MLKDMLKTAIKPGYNKDLKCPRYSLVIGTKEFIDPCMMKEVCFDTGEMRRFSTDDTKCFSMENEV